MVLADHSMRRLSLVSISGFGPLIAAAATAAVRIVTCERQPRCLTSEATMIIATEVTVTSLMLLLGGRTTFLF